MPHAEGQVRCPVISDGHVGLGGCKVLPLSDIYYITEGVLFFLLGDSLSKSEMSNPRRIWSIGICQVRQIFFFCGKYAKCQVPLHGEDLFMARTLAWWSKVK